MRTGLKIAVIKDMRCHDNAITRKYGYLCDIHLKVIPKITTGNNL